MLWTLVVFFGASIMFASIREATAEDGTAITLAAQLGAGLLLVGAILIYLRRRR